MDKRIAIVKDVVIHPISAFKEISENSKYYLPGAIVLFFGSTVLFLEGVFEGAITLALNIFFISIQYGIGRALKGKASFIGLFSALQYAYIPVLISIGIFSLTLDLEIETYAENTSRFGSIIVVGFAFLVWAIILDILAVREAHRFGTGRSIGTLIISALIITIIFAVVAVSVVSAFLGEDLL